MEVRGQTGRLAGKAGVVTGATSGLGLATLHAMTAEGAAIVAVGRSTDRGQAIVEAICEQGGRAAFITGDVSCEADIIAAIALCRTMFGSLDIMHNNAAYFTTAELHETTNEQWETSLRTNLSSVFWGSKHAVLAMREQGRGGSIVNSASVATFTATADTLAYVATKSGVMGLTRATALAYAAEGIRCNAVCPGDFESAILEQFFAASHDPVALRASIAATYPTKRILSPDDVARAVLYLASDDSNGVTGTSIVVDDGLLAKNLLIGDRLMKFSDIERTEWDYIIVGAGSAGCVVANRLSADPGVKVLLVESGGSDKSLYIQMPAATYVKAIGNPRFDWNFAVEPDPTTDGLPKTISRGRVMGGSSSINGMIYIRGFPQDYDSWAERGNAGWAWKDVLPIFKRQEDNQRGASDYHGAGGPLSVSDIRELHPLAPIFIDAAKATGIPFNDDLNGRQIEGLGYAQATQRRGWRNSSARAFIDPIRRRPNLAIATNATARRLIFDGKRVAAVEIVRRGRIVELKVRKEVVLSAGAIGSPHLLLASGVGHRERLEAVGVPVVADNPAVGQHFQDHPGINMTYGISIPTFNDEMARWRQMLHGANWLFRGRGPGATPDAHIVGFIKSDANETIPDIQVHVTPAGYALAGEGSELVLKESSFTVVVSVCRPKSRGSIDVRSSDPSAPPVIRHRLFQDEDDLTRLAKGVAVVRAIIEAAPLKSLVTRAMDPVLHTAEWPALREHVRVKARDIAHPSCSVRMGVHATAALTPDLRVKGVEGVRVADASVMPSVTSGNLNAPCMMIGEKCAELILEENRQCA